MGQFNNGVFHGTAHALTKSLFNDGGNDGEFVPPDVPFNALLTQPDSIPLLTESGLYILADGY